MQLLALLLLLVSTAVLAGEAANPMDESKVPVVVELFTSEGCSSCPPADALLSRLAREQPVPGVEIIALGMHVTYWDQLGWKDPASLRDATDRQQEYGRAFGEDRIYTPQAVIDGRQELVGSDESGVKRAIARAARQPHAHVEVTASLDATRVLVAKVSATGIPADGKQPLRLRLFVTENGLTSVVRRGENGGRTLHHDAVVRREATVRDALAGDTLAARSIQLEGIPREWQRDQLRVVALLQEDKSGRIVGAAATPVR